MKKVVVILVVFGVVVVLWPIIYAYIAGWWTGKGFSFFFP